MSSTNRRWTICAGVPWLGRVIHQLAAHRLPQYADHATRQTRLERLDCRDAFLGLMRIAAKLGIAFWGYLGDRLSIPGRPNVQYLPDLIRCRSQPA